VTPEPTISFWWDDHYTGISVCCWRYDDGRIVLYGAQSTERKARRAMRRDLRARLRLERRLAKIAAKLPEPYGS
jgi:hypothetical protein